MDQPDKRDTSRAIRRLALLQGTVFGIVVAIGSLLIVWIVLARRPAPEQDQPLANTPGAPSGSPPVPQQQVEPKVDVSKTIPWRYDLEDEKIISMVVTQNGTTWLFTAPSRQSGLPTYSIVALNSKGRATLRRDYRMELKKPFIAPESIHLGQREQIVVYFTKSEMGSHESYLEAWDARGRKRWSSALEAGATKELEVAADGTVYYTVRVHEPQGLRSGRLVALNPAGERLWQYDDDEELAQPVAGIDGRVFVSRNDPDHRIRTQGSNVRYIVCVKRGGRRSWMLDRGNQAVLPPVVGATGRLYVYSAKYNDPSGNAVLEVNPANGEVAATYPCTLFLRQLTAGEDGTIYVEKKDKVLVALGPELKIKWSAPIEYSVGDYPRLVPCSDGSVYFGDVYLRHIGAGGEDLGKFHVKAVRRLFAGPGAMLIASADDSDGYRIVGIKP